MSTIKVVVPFMSGDRALAQAYDRVGMQEIDDNAAVAIAALYNGDPERHRMLARFVAGIAVDSDELHTDIAKVAHGTGETYRPWPVELEMLATWLIDRTHAGRVDYVTKPAHDDNE